MLSQVVILSVALAIATADVSSFYPHASPQANSVDFDPNPQYSYSYSVNDAHTGDNHAQEETRNGDSVHGSYSLIEADGTLRTVKYTADAVNGFNAVVEHSGGASRSVSTPVVRIASPAPLPIARASPVVPVAPRSYSTGGAAVHTSFSGPHASYQY